MSELPEILRIHSYLQNPHLFGLKVKSGRDGEKIMGFLLI